MRRPTELTNAFEKVKKCLSILNVLAKDQTPSAVNIGTCKIGNHFFLTEEKKPVGYNLKVLVDPMGRIKIDEDGQDEKLDEYLEFYNKLGLSQGPQRQIFDILSSQYRLRNQFYDFNFKELWMTWEAILPGKRPKDKLESFIKLVSDCHKINRKRHFEAFRRYFAFKLDASFPFQDKNFYHLQENDLERFSLKFGNIHPNGLKRFKNKYMELKSLDCEFLSDQLDQVKLFDTNKAQYCSEIDKWIRNVLEEVYQERNLEVHQNSQNEFSRIALKNEFTQISSTVLRLLIQNLNKRNQTDFSKLIQKIEAIANT